MRRDSGRGEAGGPVTSQPRPVPGPRGAAVARGIGIGLMYGLWRPRVLGAWRVPARHGGSAPTLEEAARLDAEEGRQRAARRAAKRKSARK